jgi:glutaredoxin 2
VRLALGLLNINHESIVLPYDDEKTPVELAGKKMLPVFQWSEGDASNESLDIIKRLDEKNILQNELTETPLFKEEVENLLSRIGAQVHSLCMPYWIWTPEFNDSSRSYFQTKKEVKRGPFNKLIQNKDEFLTKLETILEELEGNLQPFYKSDKMSIVDIAIASHLWGMYIFPEFQFSTKVHSYLQEIRKQCHFDYHVDFWKD